VDGGNASDVLVLADAWSRDVERLVKKGARAAVLMSLESPIVAWELYYHLERISAQFRHTFLFEGARERVAPTTRFHPLHFPVPCPPPRPTGLPWANRRFMVALVDNEGVRRERDVWRTIAGLRYRPIARDRFRARLRVLEAFSARNDFDVYGDGWDQQTVIARAYRGPLAEDSLALLARYRFALVYENTRFPGYITDGLLDCFFARCVPVYSGAPDVALYIPPSAFVDVRQFESSAELGRFLDRTTEDDARRYVEAAHAFLISPTFERWCAERLARDLVEALLQVGNAA
jgi:Glycosyltransferase family 10 (fucosyltransferase) C-term